MKIVTINLPQFTLGKIKLSDKELEGLSGLLKPKKTTSIQIEIIEQEKISQADGIICVSSGKQDLILEDLEFIEEHLSIAQDDKEKNLLNLCKTTLEAEKFLSEAELKEEDKKQLSGFALKTLKPNYLVEETKNDVASLVLEAFKKFGMICFYTANEKELRAWPVRAGISALEAAGCVHSDIARGFIKAEVVATSDIIDSGGLNQAKAKGLMHLEDKEYIVKDKDLIKFRFNV